MAYNELPYFIQGLVDPAVWGNPFQSWSDPGTAVKLRYQFAMLPVDGEQNLLLFTEAQQASVRQALSYWGDVSGVSFLEVAFDAPAEVTLFRDDLTSVGAGDAAGYAWMPSYYDTQAGDVHINSIEYGDASSFGPGTYEFQVLLHEIGHALGLKHPFDPPTLPAAEDTQTNTVMTYNLDWDNAQSLGMFDLAAVHALYGVDRSAHSGASRYSFSDHYIWDGSGTDTLDASAETSNVFIRLTPGSWVHSGELLNSILEVGQAFVGYGTVVENALGGGGNDELYGNGVRNVLMGNAGDDLLAGGGGNDRLIGGVGLDTLMGGAGVDTLEGGYGNDTYFVDELDVVLELASAGVDCLYTSTFSLQLADYPHVENARVLGGLALNLTGTDTRNDLIGNNASNVLLGLGGSDNLEGAGGNDTLDGGPGLDFLNGGGGSDVLLGGVGDDLLLGGLGRDTLTGGAGRDTFIFQTIAEAGNGGGRDVIMDFTPQTDVINLQAIDANPFEAGDQLFSFIGGDAFSGVPGQLRYSQGDGILSGDIDGDNVADFQILLVGNPEITLFDLMV